MTLNNEGTLTVGGYDIVNCIRDLQARTIALERKTTMLDTNTKDLQNNVMRTDKKYIMKAGTRPDNCGGDPKCKDGGWVRTNGGDGYLSANNYNRIEDYAVPFTFQVS